MFTRLPCFPPLFPFHGTCTGHIQYVVFGAESRVSSIVRDDRYMSGLREINNVIVDCLIGFLYREDGGSFEFSEDFVRENNIRSL